MINGRRSMPDLTGARWRTSTFSGGNNECVQVADNVPHLVPVRDSKRPAGPVIGFTPDAWRSFVAHLGT
ncbi:DUF397 domain-containing protein [Streptomyces sp. NPDC090045]|uniref:DUF397 domain-containing protein n=1 Tax=Streptomyces sp. NPDC090045 TaxID=3365927 RepID=UPI00381C693E